MLPMKIGEMKLKNKKTPMRRCVGCMESKPKKDLVRIAFYEGQINIDPVGKAKGRGVYLCPDIEYVGEDVEYAEDKNIDSDQNEMDTDAADEDRGDEIEK